MSLATLTTTPTITYASKKSSLDDVRKGLYRRLMWSEDRYNTIDGAVDKLTSCCDFIMANIFKGVDSQATIAVAWRGDRLYLASQGFNIAMSEKADALSAYLSDEFAMDEIAGTVLITTTVLGLGNETGLHAEMMILRYLCTTGGIPKAQLSQDGLAVGTSSDKGCCPNCAGYMNIHGIPHTAVRPKLSGMWRHPTTLNKYMHNANNPFNPDVNVNLRYASYTGGYEINAKGNIIGQVPTVTTPTTKALPNAPKNEDLEFNLDLDLD